MEQVIIENEGIETTFKINENELHIKNPDYIILERRTYLIGSEKYGILDVVLNEEGNFKHFTYQEAKKFAKENEKYDTAFFIVPPIYASYFNVIGEQSWLT